MLASPLEQDTKVDITDLTHASVEGNGVFDVLMRAVNAHLQKEWSANRLKGTEYSTVYLGALESTMNASLQFLLARDKTNAELDILKQQLVNLKVEEVNAGKQGVLLDKQAIDLDAATALKVQQRLNVIDELLTATAQRANIANEIDVRTRQVVIAETQSTKDLLIKSAQIVSMGKDDTVKDKQALQIEAQTTIALDQSAKDLLVKTAQITSMVADDVVKSKQALLVQEQVESENKRNELDGLLDKEKLHIIAQTGQVTSQTSLTGKQELQVIAETLNVPKQGLLIDKQVLDLASATAIKDQQKINLVTENTNLGKQGLMIDVNKLQVEAQTTIANSQSVQDLLNKQAQVVSMGKDDIVKDKQASQITQQTSNLVLESLNIPKQGIVLDTQIAQLSQQTTLASAETKLVEQKYVGRKQ